VKALQCSDEYEDSNDDVGVMHNKIWRHHALFNMWCCDC